LLYISYNIRQIAKGVFFMAKMGRPVLDKPRVKSIGIRLSEEDYSKLMEYAANQNLTITEVVQKSLRLLFDSEATQ
jgi:hypothetical protein